ncbi:MAG: MBL fold metallo-hydrolase [Archaeoglobaceae archaeon]
MHLHFYGAARTVTGSCFLLENGEKLLVDCGIFQGSVEKRNYRKFSFDPSEIDFLALTHSHLDHIGLLPKLVSHGFNGEIYATEATRDIAKYMLYDAAKIQEEEAYTETKKRSRKGKPPLEPLYTSEDVEDCLKLKWKSPKYGERVHFGNTSIKFYRAGHVLGSAFIEVDSGKKFVFSGDLGEDDKLIIKDPEYPPRANYLIVESTYGDRNHKSVDESIEELKDAIKHTFDAGGNVLIPSFALERTQEILYVLNKLYREGDLPECRIFLDSPLAIDITKVFISHPELYNMETNDIKGKNPFAVPNLKYTKDVDDSKKINEVKNNAIIIAGSGMCTGGRIKHHMKHNIWRKECSLILVGFMAKGTLGRRLVDGAKTVRIYGDRIAVKSRIFTINGFSAHAGRDYLLKWSRACNADRTFVVHGEFEKSQALTHELGKSGNQCEIPQWKQNIEV